MVTTSNATKTILQQSILSQVMFKNKQNRATLVHNNSISVQLVPVRWTTAWYTYM